MARTFACDVPGCAGHRKRWQRICASCWPQLPGDIRTGIADSHKLAQAAIPGSTVARQARADHRAFCKAAADHLAAAQTRMHARQRAAFERTERLLGEHSSN